MAGEDVFDPLPTPIIGDTMRGPGPTSTLPRCAGRQPARMQLPGQRALGAQLYHRDASTEAVVGLRQVDRWVRRERLLPCCPLN